MRFLRLLTLSLAVATLCACRPTAKTVSRPEVTRTCPGSGCSASFEMSGRYSVSHEGETGSLGQCDLWLEDATGKRIAELYGYADSAGGTGSVVGDGTFAVPGDGSYHLDMTDDSGAAPASEVCQPISVTLTPL